MAGTGKPATPAGIKMEFLVLASLLVLLLVCFQGAFWGAAPAAPNILQYSFGSANITLESTESPSVFSQAVSTLKSWLRNNQILQTVVLGSVGTSLFFALGAALKFGLAKIYSWYRTDVTINNVDPSYDAIIDFITEKYLKTQTGGTCNMQVSTFSKKRTFKDWKRDLTGIGNVDIPKLDLRPASDSALHMFNYQGHNITFFRKKGETITVGYDRKPLTKEHITLSIWGTNNSVLLDLMHEAIKVKAEKRDEGLSVYVQCSDSWLGGWEKALSKQPRTLDSVIFDEDHADSILKDARKFLSSGSWYSSMGIPFRRGYLLYGPPGCGKTSFAQVLATALKLDICILNLAQKELTDNTLASNLREAPENSIILLEDIDAIFVERTSSSTSTKDGVSFSGLLNAIDGVAAQEGRIFFMTTNHIDKLDPALIRPGRCDVKLEVRNASKMQLEKMFLRFFPGDDNNATKFAQTLPGDEISMAQLQGHFLKYSHSADECCAAVRSLLDTAKPLVNLTVPIYEHLKRVGLEKYAAVFEFLGVNDARECEYKSVKLADLLAACPLLRFDVDGKKRIAKLLKRDADFMKTHYAIADLASIKEAFLTAYASTYVAATMQEGAGEHGHVSVENLAKELTSLVSVNGKSVISFCQLNMLLESCPKRPHECLAAAASLVKPRPAHSLALPAFTLPQFLKRACALTDLSAAEVIGAATDRVPSSTASTVALFLARVQEKPNELNRCEHKSFLSAIIKCGTAIESVEAPVPMEAVLFDLPSKLRIYGQFKAFYSTTASSVDAAQDLDALAYRFACAVTDADGCSLVSLLEIRSYLEKFPSSPAQAMADAAVAALVATPANSLAEIPGSSRDAPLWVYQWLAAGEDGSDSVVSHSLAQKYAATFAAEGFRCENDWSAEPAFNDNELLNTFCVKQLNERRTIARMQAALIAKAREAKKALSGS